MVAQVHFVAITMRFPIKRLLTVVAVLALASVVAIAPSVAQERPNLEDRLFADAADGQLDNFTLLEAGLIASGTVEQDALTSYVERCRAPLVALGETLKGVESTEERAEALFHFLHEQVLVGEYDKTCTKITRLLDDGDYNCVSATLVYHDLCQSFGLTPIAVATSTHVWSQFDDGHLGDVETTCRTWFDGSDRPCRDRIRSSTQPTRLLGDIPLLGKIYYNRGVSELEAERFAAAVALLRTARQFDPEDASAEENLLAAINNWALLACRRGNYHRAANLITRGLASHPNYAPYLANDLHIHQQWAKYLCKEQRFSEALAILDRAYDRRPEVELFDRGRLAVAGQWARTLLESGDYEGTWELFAATRTRFAGRDEALRYEAKVLNSAIESCMQSGEIDAARLLLSRGLQDQPGNPLLRRHQQHLTPADL